MDVYLQIHRVELTYSKEADGYGVVLGDVPPGAQVTVKDIELPSLLADPSSADAKGSALVVLLQPVPTGPTTEGGDN